MYAANKSISLDAALQLHPQHPVGQPWKAPSALDAL